MTGQRGSLVALRSRVAGPKENSWAGRQRALRMRWLAEVFPDLAEMSVIDLGGRYRAWQRAPVRPKRLYMVNIDAVPHAEVPEWAVFDQGDACALPAHITSRRYDLVFSNSVIEHVGGHERRQRFAESVHRLADAHWVQTPYRYFPIEPHWLVPGMQFLPVRARAAAAEHSPFAGVRPAHEQALGDVLSVELLDRTEMRFYFPSSALLTERVFGLPKSLIACSTGGTGNA
jgi:hypothetical protein